MFRFLFQNVIHIKYPDKRIHWMQHVPFGHFNNLNVERSGLPTRILSQNSTADYWQNIYFDPL